MAAAIPFQALERHQKMLRYLQPLLSEGNAECIENRFSENSVVGGHGFLLWQSRVFVPNMPWSTFHRL